MIQFNLLPDVKVEYVKAQRTKRLVMGSAIIATLSTFAVFILLLVSVQGVQRGIMNNLQTKIDDSSKKLSDTPDLNKILTIQNQLGALTGLHDGKVVASRTFGLLQQVTPVAVTISDYEVDYTANTMKITGLAPTLDQVNTYSDTLKFATYTADGSTEGKKAFSGVVLSQFDRGDKGYTYTILFSYDPLLFNGGTVATLVVPKTVTTLSVMGQPATIFKENPATTTTNTQGN
jgi:hypothetical protein